MGSEPTKRIIYGFHPVSEALSRRLHLQALLVGRRRRVQQLVVTAEELGIPVQLCASAELDALCGGGNHQGVAALVGDQQYVHLEDLIEPVDIPPFLIVLDGVVDPQNLGSIIRTSLVLGATGLVIPKDRAAPITPAVVRVSAGAALHLPCARVTNLARSLTRMKEVGIWTAGAVSEGGQPPDAVDLAGPLALVLGSEQKGIRPLVLKQCDFRLTIPGHSTLISLNVAAAAAALCHEASRQRRK